ncbi:MAG: prolipoprotein diacylglyceryl transferase [Gammaproteobacteria bacterium]|nr:prolipoprotein diacylglyceryl transferase [Gammaproteobacteria bacterium]
MLTYPQIDPVLLQIGPLQIHWYGVMYLLAFGSAWLLGQWRARTLPGWSKEKVGDLIFYCVVGVVLGGRIGYMLFYSLSSLITDPISVIKVWQGGMSFHGGLIGVVISMWLFAKRNNKTFFEVSDFVAPLVPLGIAAGRLGNFINGELWGKATSAPWGMVIPNVDKLPRHPSQLYELFLEGLVLFAMVWIFSMKPRPRMAVSGLFGLGYGIFRFILEFYRVPDAQYGYLAWNWFTMGQLLSLPLIFLGGGMVYLAYKRKREINYV